MKNIHIYYFLLLAMTWSCQAKEKPKVDERDETATDTSSVYTIDYMNCIKQQKSINISEIADTVEYLAYTNPRDVSLSSMRNIVPYKDWFFVNSNRNVYRLSIESREVVQFDLTQSSANWAVSLEMVDNNGIVYVIGGFREKKTRALYYLTFNTDGTLLKEQQLSSSSNFINAGSYIYYSNNNSCFNKYLLYSLPSFNSHDTTALIYNPYFAMKQKVENKVSITISNDISFYRYAGDVYYKGAICNDTVWRLTAGKPSVHAIINMGMFKLPLEAEQWYDFNKWIAESGRYWGISQIAESERYFFLLSEQPAHEPVSSRNLIFDKKCRECYEVKDGKNKGFTDDFNGGPPIWPRWHTDDYFISVTNGLTLLGQVAEGGYEPTPQLKELMKKADANTTFIILCHKKKGG